MQTGRHHSLQKHMTFCQVPVSPSNGVTKCMPVKINNTEEQPTDLKEKNTHVADINNCFGFF